MEIRQAPTPYVPPATASQQEREMVPTSAENEKIASGTGILSPAPGGCRPLHRQKVRRSRREKVAARQAGVAAASIRKLEKRGKKQVRSRRAGACGGRNSRCSEESGGESVGTGQAGRTRQDTSRMDRCPAASGRRRLPGERACRPLFLAKRMRREFVRGPERSRRQLCPDLLGRANQEQSNCLLTPCKSLFTSGGRRSGNTILDP